MGVGLEVSLGVTASGAALRTHLIACTGWAWAHQGSEGFALLRCSVWRVLSTLESEAQVPSRQSSEP